MHQFYYTDNVLEETIILPEDEAHHALKVLRKNQGDTIIVVDGKGGKYETILETDNIHNCKLKIIDKKEEFGKASHYIHIAIAPPKSHDRAEWFVEKVVEMGIQEISFITTQYSQRNNVKLNRIRKTAISAMKQSLKSYLPQINDIINFVDFIEICSNRDKYVGYLGIGKRKLLHQISLPDGNYCVLIGPEGDFIPEEIEAASNRGFKCISLGNSRLRTETAGIVACQILNNINEK